MLEESSGRAELHYHHHKLRHRAIRLPNCGRSEELRPRSSGLKKRELKKMGRFIQLARGRDGFCR
jgi:hypothetical protein